MAITNAGIEYASGYELNTDLGRIGGAINYRPSSHGDSTLSFIDTTILHIKAPSQALHPTQYSSGNREVIYTLNNGIKLCATQWVESTEHTGALTYTEYTYHIRFEYVTKTGATVNLGDFGSDTERLYKWNTMIGGGYPIWDNDIQYIPTTVAYNENEPPVIGDDPSVISLLGFLLIPKHLQPEPIPVGEITQNALLDDYVITSAMVTLNNDTDYDDLIGVLENAGDGKPIHDKSNPQTDDPSHGGGNDGRYDPWGSGDTSQVAGLPTTDVGATGLMTLYSPSAGQLRDLSSFLWSDSFIDTIKKLKNDPFESIIGLNMIPFAPNTSGSEIIQIGNCNSSVSAPLCSQYKQINCGAIQIQESWGSFLDYSPYTRVEIYLPFVGMRTLKTDDVMGKSVGVVYNIDCVTGSAMCCVTANGNVLYTFNCDVAYHVPLTGSNMNEMIKGILSTVGVGIATAGVGASVGAAGGLLGSATAPYMAGSTGLTIASALNVVGGKEHSVVRSGALSGSTGILGDLIPYVVIHRPIQSLPANFGHFKGFMSSITNTLGGFSGYTEVAYAHLDGVTATDEEKNEIMSLLSQGVIV